MPWKYNGQILKEGREFTGTDGTQYPKVWMRYSADEKKTIGIRIPNHNIPQLLVNEIGNPILSSSVRNDDKFIEYSTDPELIHKKYSNQIDIVIDSGIGSSVPSTVIDYSSSKLKIIRKGLGEIEGLF